MARERVLSVTLADCRVDDGHTVPIVGHPAYFVCGHGIVYTAKSGVMRRLKPQHDQDGYQHVVLSTDGHPHTIKIQRLVATHFIGPKPDGMVVCHNDGNKDNNAVSNLRYDTQHSNIADIKIHGRENPPRGSRNGQAKLTEDQVIKMRRAYSAGGVTHKTLGDRYGVSREQARDIINGKGWRHV